MSEVGKLIEKWRKVQEDKLAMSIFGFNATEILNKCADELSEIPCEGCGIRHLKVVLICAHCIRTASLEARKLERAKVLEEAARAVDEWNDSIKNGEEVRDLKHIRAALGVAASNIRSLAAPAPAASKPEAGHE